MHANVVCNDLFVFLCMLSSLLSGLGGWYSYRMSKAALNMATRNLSIELGRSRPKVGLRVTIKYHKQMRQRGDYW